MKGQDLAISPPSDLVLDVVRAADPTEVQAAQAKLKSNRAAFAASSLADAGKGFGAAMGVIDTPGTAAGLDHVGKSSKIDKSEMPDEYRKFEASILSTFVNSMLPSESEEVYGKGSAGDFWKGMMAEKISDEMSKSGGIGIAEQMYSKALERAERSGMVHASTNEDDRSRAAGMIDDFQRQVLGISATETKKA